MTDQTKIVNIWKNTNIVTPDEYKFMKAYYASVRAAGRVLDIGSNNGWLGQIIAKRPGLDYIGIDINDFVIKNSVAKVINHDITIVPWPFEDNSFDTVCWLEGPELFIDVDDIFKEIRRVLKPKGLLLLATPKFTRFLSPEFPRMYEYGVNEILEIVRGFGFAIQNFQEVSAYKTNLNRRMMLIDAIASEKVELSYWDQRAIQQSGYGAVVTPGNIKEKDEQQAKREVDQIRQVVSLDNRKVIDVGCGIGRLTKFLSPFCRELEGFDRSFEMIKRASMNCPDVEFKVAQLGKDLPYASESFDVSICWYVLMHVLEDDQTNKNFEKAVDELKRITKHSIVVSDNMLDHWKDKSIGAHCKLRTLEQYKNSFKPFVLVTKVDLPVGENISTILRFDRDVISEIKEV